MIEQTSTTKGKLYIVATPIGNFEDLTPRARRVLSEVDFILAEDTRHSQRLLHEIGLSKPIRSYHAHNENVESLNHDIVSALKAGQSVALISDAGTPLISDPGYPLVNHACAEKIEVVPVPGACAVITALCASGLPCMPFSFGGFLPAKSKARQEMLTHYQTLSHTLVFYESTHRIQESIKDVEHVFGEQCQMVLAKELTKIYEHFVRGTPQTLLNWLTEDEKRQRGEFVLMIAPTTKPTCDYERTLKLLIAELPLKQAVRLTADLTGLPKNDIYQKAILLKDQNK